MSALVINTYGRVQLLRQVLPYLSTLWVALFVSDSHPSVTDAWYNYTFATFPGYSRQKLAGWGPAFPTADFRGESDGAVNEWVCTAGIDPPETVYGYMFQTRAGAMIAAARLDTPRTIQHMGDTVQVFPRFFSSNQ